MQQPCISHFQPAYYPQTPQRVLYDSQGVGVIEIGCIFAPDRCQHCQERAAMCPADTFLANMDGMGGVYAPYIRLIVPHRDRGP